MTDTIRQLEFKYWLNKQLKHRFTFDELFVWPDFERQFGEFLESRIGTIWLTKRYGKEYLKWQST